MKNFDEYVHFVVGAKIAGQEIENFYGLKYENNDEWKVCKPIWNWAEEFYRIKLPEGWEYVIEDGEIAFREPKENEYYYGCEIGVWKVIHTNCTRKDITVTIIKRAKESD